MNFESAISWLRKVNLPYWKILIGNTEKVFARSLKESDNIEVSVAELTDYTSLLPPGRYTLVAQISQKASTTEQRYPFVIAATGAAIAGVQVSQQPSESILITIMRESQERQIDLIERISELKERQREKELAEMKELLKEAQKEAQKKKPFTSEDITKIAGVATQIIGALKGAAQSPAIAGIPKAEKPHDEEEPEEEEYDDEATERLQTALEKIEAALGEEFLSVIEKLAYLAEASPDKLLTYAKML